MGVRCSVYGFEMGWITLVIIQRPFVRKSIRSIIRKIMHISSFLNYIWDKI